VTVVGGRYVTRDAAALVRAKDQHLSVACTSLNLKKIFIAIEVILLKTDESQYCKTHHNGCRLETKDSQ